VPRACAVRVPQATGLGIVFPGDHPRMVERLPVGCTTSGTYSLLDPHLSV